MIEQIIKSQNNWVVMLYDSDRNLSLFDWQFNDHTCIAGLATEVSGILNRLFIEFFA